MVNAPFLFTLAAKLRQVEAKKRGIVQGNTFATGGALIDAELGRFRFLERDADREDRPLLGGTGGGAVRIGDTVRKPVGDQSGAVLALLHHLDESGFTGAPRPINVDDQNREVYAWIEGEAGLLPLSRHLQVPAVVFEIGELLRAYHDASATFELPEGAEWPESSVGPEPHEVICHGDLTPPNIVFATNGTPIALVDFENAGPGPRWWDLAIAAYHVVPLARDQQAKRLGFMAPPDRAARLVALLDGYGVAPTHRAAFVPWVSRRLEWYAASIRRRAADGNQRALVLLEEGYVASIERDLAWLEHNSAALEAALG